MKDPDYELVQYQRRIESSSESEDEDIIMDDNKNPNKTDIRTIQTDVKQKNENTTNIMENTILNEQIDNTAKQLMMTENDDRMRQEMLDAIASIVPTGRETPTFVSENRDPTADLQMSTNNEATPAKKEKEKPLNEEIEPKNQQPPADVQKSTNGKTTPAKKAKKRPFNEAIVPENQLPPADVQISTNEDPTPTKKGKKRPLNKENWKKNITKQLRNAGQSYVSKASQKTVPPRQLREPCKETCIFKCQKKFSEEQRREILKDYWNLGEIEKQWSFIAASVEEAIPANRYVKLNDEGQVIEPKRTNNAFYLITKGKKYRVCKVFFKNTLCINNRPITTALSKKNKETNISLMTDNRGRHGKQPKIDDNIKEGAKQFIDSIPKIESHYTRAHSRRTFIDGSKTISDLHHDYVEICKEKKVPFINYVMFYRIFTQEHNISFFTPKKDMCDVCEAFKNSSPEEKEAKKDTYEKHHEEKRLSRLEKENDKKNEELTVCVYDLQAVFQCPKGEISVFYYKSKLNVLNLTVYDVQKNTVECYVWDEANASRGVNEIGTCVFKYLEQIISNGTKDMNVVFYSDNCAGQQKNKFMVAMYLFAVQKFPNIKSITHKYLIRGHTQNEGDSAHSQIERQVRRELRKGPMYSPDAFISAIKSARKKSEPFRVNEMCFEDFYDWKNVCSQMSFAIQKDDENVPVKISEVKMIKVIKDDARAIYYKNSYTEEEFKRAIVIKKKKEIDNNIEVKKAYTTKPGIAKRKKADLMELINKNHIPRYYRPFYESL